LQAPDPQAPAVPGSELRKRVVSSVVLGIAALVTAWLGGNLFLLFWMLAAYWVWMEWVGIVGAQPRSAVLPVGAASVLGMSAALYYDAAAIAAVVAIIGAGVVSATVGEKRGWVAAGVIYAALVLIPAVILRADPKFGLIAIFWLFAAVWTADIAAYFAGRIFGGPLLAPRISPKKTWSGALGGLIGGVAVSSVVALVAGLPLRTGLILAAAVVVIASQAGDLLESFVKRHFGVKDAGQLIPGHGGMMDRLDGFLVAALAALLIGVARAGTGTPAAGLLAW
jgi:phosphatidate cytidylyltransferase